MLTQRQRLVALAAAVTFALGACGQATDDTTPGGTPSASPSDDATTSSPSEEDTMKPSPIEPDNPDAGALPTGPVPESVTSRPEVVAAIEDYAKRRDVAVEDVTVAGFAEVTWSDGSIGCPEPGMMYTQALVPGLQLVLEVDGELASYHAADGQPFFYCANPIAPAEGGNPAN